MNEYSTFDIIRILDIPRERLQDWMNRNFIIPSIRKAEGKGTKNVFSRNDLYGIELFSFLINNGIKRKVASSLIKHLVAFDFDPMKCGEKIGLLPFISRPDLEKRGGFMYSDLLSVVEQTIDYDIAFLINLKNIYKKVDSKVE